MIPTQFFSILKAASHDCIEYNYLDDTYWTGASLEWGWFDTYWAPATSGTGEDAILAPIGSWKTGFRPAKLSVTIDPQDSIAASWNASITTSSGTFFNSGPISTLTLDVDMSGNTNDIQYIEVRFSFGGFDTFPRITNIVFNSCP